MGKLTRVLFDANMGPARFSYDLLWVSCKILWNVRPYSDRTLSTLKCGLLKTTVSTLLRRLKAVLTGVSNIRLAGQNPIRSPGIFIRPAKTS